MVEVQTETSAAIFRHFQEPIQPPEALKMTPQEKNRLIAHLGRVFTRRYDIQVIPSGQKGVWATGLDPKITQELQRYIMGQRDTLDDLPRDAFQPKRILYDEQSAQEMSMDDITAILRHEAGHAKYTDFKLMFEGQRMARDQAYLPTSFWLMFEGLEDPRVNALEGEESPAIDKQIRASNAEQLQARLAEGPLAQKPMMLQFAYNSFHYWLHGQGIPELAGTEVGRLTEAAKPLIEQYFQNTDLEQRRLLQGQLWDIVKVLEKKEIEQEQQRQMAKQRQQGQQGGQQSGQGQTSGQTQVGEGEGQPAHGTDSQTGSQHEGQPTGSKRFLDRIKELFSGKKDDQQSSVEQQGKPAPKPKPEKLDLSKLSEEELQAIRDAIEQLSPEERAELAKKAKEAIDEVQKDALEEELNKTMKLEKNKQTGEYEVRPQVADEKTQRQSEEDYKQALAEVEAAEQAEFERQEDERRAQEEALRKLEAQRREKLEMEKAGFEEDERDKYLLYQSLEDAMYAHVRNFQRAIEKVIPRRRESLYEGGYFSGPKLDKRDLVRKAPVGDERFHMRQIERPTGEPRLFTGLLVDNSGSMAGQKTDNARKAVIFFAKVCKDMGIPFMAAAFGDDAEVIKEFRQDFNNPAERIKPKIIDATDASGHSTNMHAGIEVTIAAMNDQRRRLRDSHGLIFVITDGGANAGLTGDALRNYIAENRGRLTFKAFGLSGNAHERASIQQSLNHYFGESNCVYPQGFDDLGDEAFRVLRVSLMQFQRFLS